MEFSKPEYWSVQPFPFPGDLPNPGIETKSPASQVDSLPAAPPGKSESRKSSHLVVSAIPWSAACQVPRSMGFPRREYWSGFPFPSPGDLLNPGMKLKSPAWQADSLPLSHQGSPQYQNCIQAKLLQLYPILCNPMDCNPPGSSVNFQH